MSFHIARGVTAAFVAFIAANPAQADVTAQEVWGEMKAYLTSSGYQLSASESMAGNVLTVSDVVMSMDIATAQGGSGRLDISQITMTENGDGTVSVALPSEIPISFTMPTEDGGSGSGQMRYTLTGTDILASGTVEDLTFDTNAEAIGFAIDDLTVDGAPDAPEAVEMSFNMTNVQGQTRIVKSAMREYTQQMTADAMSYLLAVDAPDGGEGAETARFEGTLNGLTFDGSGTLPEVTAPGDLAAMLRDGMKADMTFGYTSGMGNVAGSGPEGDFAMQSSSSGGTIGIVMNADKLLIDTAQTGSTITVQTKDIPFPVTMQMAEIGYLMDLPVSKSDTEQPFALKLKLGDFAIADQLWGMLDPAGVLPHDPANIVLNLTGTGKLFFDMFDPVAMATAEASGTKPGELNSVMIKDLLVSVAGAELTGTGDFLFDNSMAEANGGMPVPVGNANLKLIGANGLIDNLIKMGMLQEQDAMGARMMMGMMAVPGEGEDTLLSTIEMNDKGQIFANGQRLK